MKFSLACLTIGLICCLASSRVNADPETSYTLSSDSSGIGGSSSGSSSSSGSDSDSDVENSKPLENTYGVIVDCGSSGTRANLYEWDSNKEYPELLHDIEPMRGADGQPLSIKKSPGLSTLADNPSAASDYIQPIIDYIIEKIPKSRISYTGVYILATAGMRLLGKKTQLSIMNDIKYHLKSNYNFGKVTTSVISGADEGMYEWINVNAKLKRFLEANLPNPRTQTYAVVEMGGASVQITYQLRPGMEKQLEDWLSDKPDALDAAFSAIVEPQISRDDDEHNFRMVSVSLLGLGSNSAREAYVDILIKSVSNRWYLKAVDKYFNTHYTRPRKEDHVLQLEDPCLPRGVTMTMAKPIRMLHSIKTVGFIAEEDDETFKVELWGSGKFSKCKHYLEKLLIKAKRERLNCEENEACTMSLLGTNFVPFHRFHFVGLAEFFYTTDIMGLSGTYDTKKVISKTKHICSTPFKELKLQFPKVKDELLQLLCFKAVWTETFLHDGINMPEILVKFTTIGDIRGDKIDWTLGAVLDKSLAIEAAVDKPSRLSSPTNMNNN